MIIKTLLLVLSLSASFLCASEEMFSKEALKVGPDSICVISSFDQITYLTSYSHTGEPIWEMAFQSQILSWEMDGEQILIFSKASNSRAFFLSCLEAKKGILLWEKVVVAPSDAKTEF